MDPRVALARRVATTDRERRVSVRALFFMAQGMLFWGALLLIPALFMGFDAVMPGLAAVFFAATPVNAWYSWRLAAMEYQALNP